MAECLERQHAQLGGPNGDRRLEQGGVGGAAGTRGRGDHRVVDVARPVGSDEQGRYPDRDEHRCPRQREDGSGADSHTTSAIAATTRSARTKPSAPSLFSNHSVVRWVFPALPPATSAMAGTPKAMGTLASVDAQASSCGLLSALLAATAACTRG